jgi:hypothetical protein
MGRWGTPLLSFNRYKVMWDAIKATGRPMLYSLCSWGEDYVHTVSKITFTASCKQTYLHNSFKTLQCHCRKTLLKFDSGECPLRILGGCLGTYMTLSVARMTSVAAISLQIQFVLLQEVIAPLLTL